MEDNFSRARMQSTRNTNYNAKTSKNNIRNEFINAYAKPDYQNEGKIKEIARTFILLERGIVPESCPDYKIDVSQETIKNIFLKIKETSNDNFIKFYESYLRKIELGYREELVESSLEDTKTAYQTLRKCHLFTWECPEKIITIKEMENLYLLLTRNKKDKNDQEKDIEK